MNVKNVLVIAPQIVLTVEQEPHRDLAIVHVRQDIIDQKLLTSAWLVTLTVMPVQPVG